MAKDIVVNHGWNPPIPGDSASDSKSSSTSTGQRLLSLVRALERKNMEDSIDRIGETVEIFHVLISTCLRRGIFQGNNEKAEKILASIKSNPFDKQHQHQKQRGSKKGAANDLQIHQGDDSIGVDSSLQTDEMLIYSALLRIFGSASSAKQEGMLSDHLTLLIQNAAELIVAMSEGIKSVTTLDNCAMAEYEILAQNGKPFLTGLANSIQLLESDLLTRIPIPERSSSKRMIPGLDRIELDGQMHVGPIQSCLRALASLVSLFGTKLSRSTAILTDLKALAWRLVVLPNDDVNIAAARLIATLPLAGGTDRKAPSDLWNKTVADVILSLDTLLKVMAPLQKNASTKTNVAEGLLSEDVDRVLSEWISYIKEGLSNEAHRISAFKNCMGGMTLCFRMLMAMDSLPETPPSPLMGARLDVASILNLVESFLSFPLLAEGVYYRTKKRLRSETVDGGMLSPSSIAVEMASQVKLWGHAIMDDLLNAAGGPALLPYARRIIRISYASLLTSCSGAVRKVLDPTSIAQLDGKKRRWLHTSIPLRTTSIQTCIHAMLSFGSDKSGRSELHTLRRMSPYEKSDGERTVTLVAGCLMEQIGWNGSQEDGGDTWGSTSERADLV